MSSGHRGTEHATVGAVVNLISRQPGLQWFLKERIYAPVSREFLVPYGAGRSSDGRVTYIDQNIPVRFKMGIEPDEFAAGHEGFEWWLMTRLNKCYWKGGGAKSAHWWATGYEHMLLKLSGASDADVETYEAEWASYVTADEAERVTADNLPPDLYAGPYEEYEDSDNAEDLIGAKVLPKIRAARLRAMPVRMVG